MANASTEVQNRFTQPKMVIASPAKVASVGLPENRSTRTVLQHAFEAQVAHRNLTSAEKQAKVPEGLRFSAKQCFLDKLHRDRDETSEWKAPNKPAFRETLTSLDNPLRTPANDASVTPFYVARGLQAQVEDVEAAKGKRCFPRNERYGTMEQLAPGCLVPATAEELKQARMQALQADTDSTSAGDEADIEGAGAAEDAAEEQAPAPLGISGFPIALNADDALRRKQQVRKTAAEERARQVELEEQLLKEYPHGVPKQVLINCARQGIMLPHLGYGCASSVSAVLAAATLRSA